MRVVYTTFGFLKFIFLKQICINRQNDLDTLLWEILTFRSLTVIEAAILALKRSNPYGMAILEMDLLAWKCEC